MTVNPLDRLPCIVRLQGRGSAVHILAVPPTGKRQRALCGLTDHWEATEIASIREVCRKCAVALARQETDG